MRELFPYMNVRPATVSIIGIFSFWILAFFLIPLYMPFLCLGLWDELSFMSWADCIYHCLNAFVVAIALKEHYKECFISIQIDLKEIVLTLLAAIMMMVSYVLIIVVVIFLAGFDPYFLIDVFPMSEFTVSMTPCLLVTENPIFGTLCVSLVVPIAICGLFYATGFAPLCCNNKWLGYIIVAAILFIPVLFDIIWRGNAEFLVYGYLFSLPVHLVACWSYQKTDCIWTPVCALIVFNLLASIGCLIIG